ncbi:MAG: H-X9-DG-CTERM domain-containing protein, partial [Limisphaerales bacterium]
IKMRPETSQFQPHCLQRSHVRKFRIVSPSCKFYLLTLPYQGGATVNGLTSLIKFSQIQTAGPGVAQTICFVDESPSSVDDGCFGLYNSTAIASGPDPDRWWNLPTSAHDDGCIFAFCDGHVEYWRWHGSAIRADNAMPYSTYGASGNWPADPLTGSGSSTDLPRAANCQVQ